MVKDRIGVLFVCLGNICRSPLAKGVFQWLVEEEELTHRFRIDSAGTSNYHTGEPADRRTSRVARSRGIEFEHAARQITARDLEEFDYVLVMDESNMRKVRKLADSAGSKREIAFLRTFDPEANGDREVPDPWGGGLDGFEEVQDMVERACRGLLAHIREQRGI